MKLTDKTFIFEIFIKLICDLYFSDLELKCYNHCHVVFKYCILTLYLEFKMAPRKENGGSASGSIRSSEDRSHYFWKGIYFR